MHIILSANIAHLRKKHGLTQETLSNFLDITRSRLSSYEEFRVEPPIHLVQRIAEVFRCSVDQLLTKKFQSEETSDLFFFQL